LSDGEKPLLENLPSDGLLKREHFTAERVRAFSEFITKQGGSPHLMSEEAREASRKEVHESVEPGQDVWVFGYGSLMWNPAIHVAESRIARIEGYSRAFCLTLSMGRGTPEKPGLMLGLDEGGTCHGIAHRIAAENVESELTVLWHREMLSGSYAPSWLQADIRDLGEAKVLTFVIKRDHPRYEGILDDETVAARIAGGEGILGTNRDYLFRTAEHLRSLGIAEDYVDRLDRRVRELTNAKGSAA